MRTDLKEVYDFVQAHPEVQAALKSAFATSVDNVVQNEDEEEENDDSESERIATLLLSDLSEFGDDVQYRARTEETKWKTCLTIRIVKKISSSPEVFED